MSSVLLYSLRARNSQDGPYTHLTDTYLSRPIPFIHMADAQNLKVIPNLTKKKKRLNPGGMYLSESMKMAVAVIGE